ncbi:MAG: hypothetical protein ACRETU_11200, partial [Steroidobacterales bacterium]
MFFSSNRAARLRAYVLLALLPALLLRAAVPVGYMVSFTESVAAAITLCPGVASVPASASHQGPVGPAGVDDHSTHHQHGEHDHAGSHSSGHDHSQPACPFAAALV